MSLTKTMARSAATTTKVWLKVAPTLPDKASSPTKHTLTSLPSELLIEILSYLSPPHSNTARLACRAFNATLARQTFRVLASFVDSATAKAALEATLAKPAARARCIWSSDCSIPTKLDTPESFLFALHIALLGRPWSPPSGAASESPDEDNVQELSIEKLCQVADKENLTREAVRTIQFRYMLYLNYINTAMDSPSVWAIHPSLWWFSSCSCKSDFCPDSPF